MNGLVSPGHSDLVGRAGEPRLSEDDRLALLRAVSELERISLPVRLCAILGRRTGAFGSVLPASFTHVVSRAADAAMRGCLDLALRSLAGKSVTDRRRLHRNLAGLAGAAGGAFGFSSLPVELPITTTIMLRGIADIGRSEGEDFSNPRAALACLEVFALGGSAGSNHSHAAEAGAAIHTDFNEGAVFGTGYFALRAMLARSVSEAANYLAARGASREIAPALVRFVTQVSGHFGAAVSQKLLAQSVPIIGAAGGAAINYAFANHFETVAHGHFTVRRLERRYGAPLVQAEYERIRRMGA